MFPVPAYSQQTPDDDDTTTAARVVCVRACALLCCVMYCVFGCVYARTLMVWSTLISARTRVALEPCFGITLMATRRPVTRCTASYTNAYAPAPIFEMNMYLIMPVTVPR